MGVHYGTCCHWNAEARFGFIAIDAPIVEVADRDLYVGWRSLQRSGINKLERGDRVSFDIGRAKDGRPEATNIQIIEALAA